MEAAPRGSEELIASKSASATRVGRGSHILALLLRIALGVVFLYAGSTKARDPAAFVSDLRGFRVFPEITVLPLAAYVPYLELLVGGALIFAIFYSGALLLAGCLLAMFTGVILSAMWRGIDIACGCFGHHGTNAPLWVSALRNGFLILVWCVLARNLMRRMQEVAAATSTR